MTSRKRQPKPVEPPSNADNPAQSRAFIHMAREVEADETPGMMDRVFSRIVKTPKPERTKKTRPK